MLIKLQARPFQHLPHLLVFEIALYVLVCSVNEHVRDGTCHGKRTRGANVTRLKPYSDVTYHLRPYVR